MGFSQSEKDQLKKDEQSEYEARLAKMNTKVSSMKQAEQEGEQDDQDVRPALTSASAPSIDGSHPIASALSVLVALFLKKNDLSDEEKRKRIEEERAKLAKADQRRFDQVRESMDRIREKNKPKLTERHIEAAQNNPRPRQSDSDLPVPRLEM